jgi:hypothetical protein
MTCWFPAGLPGQPVGMLQQLSRGVLAGLAGTTALNAVTYADMVLRGRPPSSAPERMAGELARRSGVAIPGTAEQRQNRLPALGALAGAATGAVAWSVLDG